MKKNTIVECPECGATMPSSARTCFVCGFEQVSLPVAEAKLGGENAATQEKTITCSGPLKLIITISQD